MADYEDTGYYEIQLNNKQLVFFFMAGLAIAVVIFLCGVMVGRGVKDATTASAAGGSARLVAAGEDQTVAARRSIEEQARRELDYPERLESSGVDDRLETSSSPENLVSKNGVEAKPVSAPEARSSREEAAAPKPAVSRSSDVPSARDGSGYTIQVVALKTRDAAQTLVSRLENQGYPAYLEAEGSAGLYRVRVGRFDNRAEAEKVAADLREAEKFKPYITTQ